MKLFIGLLGLLLITVLAAAKDMKIEEKAKQAIQECAKDRGITEEEMKSRSFSEERDKERDCFEACVLNKLGIMESGKLSKDGIVKMVEESIDEKEETISEILKAANTCVDEVSKSDDECEMAGAFSACYHGKMKGFFKE